MSIANKLQAARTTFETLVESLEPKGEGLATRLAKEVSGADGQTYEFDMAGAAPGWARWVGPKAFDGFREMSVSCPFDKQHKSLKLKRKDVVNDKTGTVGQLMSDFMGPHDYLYDKLVMAKFVANPTCIDGGRLFSTAHAFGSGGTWSNKTTDALSFSSFDSARAAGRNLLNEKGEPIGIEYDTLVVNPNEELEALEIANASLRATSINTAGTGPGVVGGAAIDNVYKGITEVVVTPRQASGDWALVDSKRGAPIGLVVWRGPEAVISDDMSGDHRQIFDEFLYSVEADVNACGLLPYGVYGKSSAS